VSSRNYPRESLQSSLVVPQKLAEGAGRPMNRLLVADTLGIKPASTNFRYLLSSSRSYGLTEGTEKAVEVSLTPLGREAISTDAAVRRNALQRAATTPDVFKRFFERFNGNKLPSPDMMAKLLIADFDVSPEFSEECADLIRQNGELVGIIRNISGSRHVMLGQHEDLPQEIDEPVQQLDGLGPDAWADADEPDLPLTGSTEIVDLPQQRQELSPIGPKPIFVGHGKKKGPLEKLEKLLAGFQIPFKVAVGEPNLGRPIPIKVKEIMDECGSAILIFTQDELFLDEDGNKVWRPSENVVHELGAASYAYGDRIVIFKEAGLKLASNFQSIGYIEFDENGIEAKTMELLQELIGFGLVRITPAA